MVHLQKISWAEACAHLANFKLIDPQGRATVEAVVKAGEPFALDLQDGRMVYVLELQGPALWITAAAGNTRQATAPALRIIEHQARQAGAQSVNFQTARPGLVKRVQAAGYRVKGWVLEKAINEHP